MEQPGLTIDGRYKLVKNLNKNGGMGTIWVADDLQINKRQVAVKFPLEEFRQHTEALARFDREAEIAVQIGGPNVIQILARGKTEDAVPYIVMELLDGQDLAQFISENAPCGLLVTQGIIAQLFRVTARLHNLNIVHRDIKSSNIFLIAESDGTHSVKLLDFGIAKQRLNNGAKSLTRDFMSIGSALYMAPEQMVNTRTVGRPADLWAIGVVTYEMLTGRMPFEMNPDDSLPAFYAKVEAGIYPPATSLNRNLPPDIDLWFSKALRPNPEQRFQTVEAMSTMLAKITSRATASVTTLGSGALTPAGQDLPVLADPPPRLKLGQDTHVLKSRRSAPWWAIAAAGVVMLGGGGAYWQNEQARKEAAIKYAAELDEKRKADEEAKRLAAEEAKRAAARAAAGEASTWAADAGKARWAAESAAVRAKGAFTRLNALEASEAAAEAKVASAHAEEAARMAGSAASRASADPEAAKRADTAYRESDASAKAAAIAASKAQKDADAASKAAIKDGNARADAVIAAKNAATNKKKQDDDAAAAAKAKEAAEKAAWYTPTETQRTALIKAVKEANAAETIAFRSLNGSNLATYEEGPQLSDCHRAIAALKTNNTYKQGELLNWNADLFSVNYYGDRAKVHVTETWKASFWDRDTNLCKWRVPSRPVPQTIHLHLTSGRWKVTDVKYDRHYEPERVACVGN